MDTFLTKVNAEAYLGATALALQDALEAALWELALAYGTGDLSWFDVLHQEAVRSTKGMVIEEVSVEINAGARRYACEVLDAKFQSLRISFVEKQE